MFKKIIATILIIVFSSLNASAQEETKDIINQQDMILNEKIGVRKQLKLAKKLEGQGSYVNAVVFYEKAIRKKPKNKCITCKLAELNFKLKDYEESEKWYGTMLKLDPKYCDNAQFFYAKSLKHNGKCLDAKKEFEKAREGQKKGKMDAVISNEIAGCDICDSIILNPNKEVKVEHVEGLNGNLQEYAPRPIGKDKIIYSSLISDTALNLSKLRKKSDYYTKLLFSSKDGGVWSEPVGLPENINNPKMHVGNGFMSEDGTRIYYTECKEGPVLNMECKIFLAVKDAEGWKTEELDVLNNAGNTNTQPSIYTNKDGKSYLFFSSDRDGGSGGMDIYYSELDKDGRPGKPVNAGSINTFGNEISPMYSVKEGKLFFSSDGRPSIGGLDVFETTGEPGNWGEVKNVGSPINSHVDDLYFSLNDNSKGFMTSNRPGSISTRGKTCCDDIWSVDFTRDIYVKIGILAENCSKEKSPLYGSSISMYNDKGELTNSAITKDKEDFVVFKLDPGQTYKINSMKDGYFPVIEMVSTPSEINKTDTIEKILVHLPICKTKYVIEPLYFAFDKSQIREPYYFVLDSILAIMAKFPNLYLKIDGHTDSKGTVAYNQGLSERRCKAAAEYCIKKGLAMDRIIMKGYSELVPIDSNTLADGSDNPAGRDRNRRVEFRILSEAGSDPGIEIEYKDTVPQPQSDKERGINTGRKEIADPVPTKKK